MTKQPTVECSKCDGIGVIQAFGHYAEGVCFQCKGTGRLNGKTVTARRQLEVSAICYVGRFDDDMGVCEVRTQADWDRNPSYYEAAAKRAAETLLALGDREWSKALLARTSNFVAARICEAGRELKAA